MKKMFNRALNKYIKEFLEIKEDTDNNLIYTNTSDSSNIVKTKIITSKKI